MVLYKITKAMIHSTDGDTDSMTLLLEPCNEIY